MQLNDLLYNALEHIVQFLSLRDYLNFLKTNKKINALKTSTNMQKMLRQRLIADNSPLPELHKTYLASPRIADLTQQGRWLLVVKNAVVSLNKIVTNRTTIACHYQGAREEAIRLGYSPKEVRPDWFSSEHVKALRNGTSYEDVSMLSSWQIEGINLGLKKEQVTSTNFSSEHLQKLKTWKQQTDPNNNIQQPQDYYDSIKDFNATQLNGLEAGFSEEDVKSMWFSYKHVDLLLQKYYSFDELRKLNIEQLQAVELGVDPDLVREFNVEHYHIEVLRNLLLSTNNLSYSNNAIHIDLSSAKDLKLLFSLSSDQLECLKFSDLTIKQIAGYTNLSFSHANLLKRGIPFELIKDLPEKCLMGISGYSGIYNASNEVIKKLINILITTNKTDSHNYQYNRYFYLAYNQGIPLDILKQLTSHHQLKGMVKYNLSIDQVMHPNIENILRAMKKGYTYNQVCNNENFTMLHAFALKMGEKLEDIIALSTTDLIEKVLKPRESKKLLNS